MNLHTKRPREIELKSTENDAAFVVAASSKKREADDLIADIHSALTTKQRLSVLKRLQRTLQQDTEKEARDDTGDLIIRALLQAGIVSALSLQLHHLLHRHGSTATEVESICHCLDLLFRRYPRPGTLQQTIEKQGVGFLELLSGAVSMAMQNERATTLLPVSTPCATHSVLSIFHVISACPAGAKLLLQSRSVGHTVVDALTDEETSDDAVLEALGMLKNLTYFDEDQHSHLLQAAGLLPSLTSLPSRPCLSMKSRQRLSAILRNFTVSAECRSLLVRKPAAVGMLVQLMMSKPVSTGESERSDYRKLRHNLLNALIGLSMDNESSLLLIFYGDGILLKLLKRYLKDSTDEVVRKRAARILRLLAHERSAPLLVHDADLMHVLSEAALYDPTVSVRQEASEAFTRCAALVQAEHQPHFQSVLDALTLLTKRQDCRRSLSNAVLAQALKEQSSYPCNRKLMAERSVLVESVAQIALSQDSPTAVNDACCTLKHLSTEEANSERLAKIPAVLDALVANVSSYSTAEANETTFPSEKENSVQTLVHLASATANRKIMVQHTCLLQSMIHVARSAPSDNETKAGIKKAILLLASEL